MANHAQTIEARATLITLMLREDHQKITQLFDQFDHTTNINEKREIVTTVCAALEVHANLEEKLIYPAWRAHVDEQDLIDEALKEHQGIHVLINALTHMDPEDERYEATCTVLREQVTHHINEEEGKMFSQAEKAELDWERLTTHVVQRRQRLEHKPLWLLGVPVRVSARETGCATRAVFFRRSGGEPRIAPVRR